MFSLVQLIVLFSGMIKNMFIAKYLGVEATGIVGVLQTVIGFFIAFCSLGLPVLLVRSFALNSNSDSNNQQLIIKRLIFFSGILGAVLFFFLTPQFANTLFKRSDYEWILKVCAIVILFKQLTVINTSILQGRQQLAVMAKVNAIAAIFSVLISIPMFYFFKIEGVIYAFILSFIIETLISQILKKEEKKIEKKSFRIYDYYKLLKEGFLLGYGNVLAVLSQLVVIYYITEKYGILEVGYYNAGFAIINNYVALIFVAMSTGYLPRIIKLLANTDDLEKEIAKQLNFSIVVMGLLATICILFAQFIVKILFSQEFMAVVQFLRIAVLGMLFKTFSWCLGYLIIAKVDTKVLIFTGVFYNVLYAVMLVFGYEILGLKGVGYAFVLYNFVHLLGIWIITRYKYSLLISNKTIFLFLGMLLINILLLLL